MNLQQLYHSVLFEPWLLSPMALEALRVAIADAIKNQAGDPPTRGKTAFGEDIESIQIANGLAVVPIKGIMARNPGRFGEAFGMVDMGKIASELDYAAESSRVLSVLLDFDTPGGSATGTPELAAKIASLREQKDVYSFVGGQCCSAGIYVASQSGGIFATPSSVVGSIGAYSVFHDMTNLAAMNGIKVDVISSGEFKGMGEPGTSLSPEQRQHLQDFVNKLANDFKNTIAEARPNFDSELMNGQIFTGSQGAENGLIDILVNSKQEAIQALGFDSSAFAKRQ